MNNKMIKEDEQMETIQYPKSVSQWGVFEVSCKGDSEGVYKVRFMPRFMETYTRPIILLMRMGRLIFL